MNDDILSRLIRFVNTFAGVPVKKITGNAELENDLGISGDDAVEFVVAFGEEFNVDVSKFVIKDYFSPEGDPGH